MTVEQALHLGIAAGKSKDFPRAIQIFEEILKVDPNNSHASANIGNALVGMGRLEEAIASFERSVGMNPQNPIAFRGYGGALHKIGRLDEAIKAFTQSLKISPNDAETHGSLAHVLLLSGDLKRGFMEYEWRWKCVSFDMQMRTFPQPRWTGGKIAERRILVYSEQGLGDAIQFLRYVPMLAERGAEVIVEAQPALSRLVRRMESATEFIPRGSQAPQTEFHAPLLSLAAAFNTTLATIPANVPYLHAQVQQVSAWREKLAGDPGKLKVGIAWAGNPTHTNDHNRSCRLSQFAPLANVPDVTFYSLQKGETARESQSPPTGMTLIDHTARLTDLDDTAALIANLDLVISVDTSIVHLAGAMARPVWTLLPFSPDWRWLLNRNDSPWYPTMRLFRQPRYGDWDSVFNDVAEALRTMSAQ